MSWPTAIPTAREKTLIRRRLAHQPPGTVALCQDEMLLREFPPLRAAWALRGQQAVVPLSGSNARRVLFGVLNWQTGHVIQLVRPHNRTADFAAFLHHLRACYRRWRRLLVLLDRGPSHEAKAIAPLAQALNIHFCWLPTACPELNPIEHLWRPLKQQVAANRCEPTIDRLAQRAMDWLDAQTPTDRLRYAGTRSKNFWLPT